MKKIFYGWFVTAAAICTFGIAVGIPYYNMPFFYDYYKKAPELGGFGWATKDVTLGFPLAALLTLWVGPILVPRFSPRKLIMAGTALTAAAFFGFSSMTGSLPVYYFFWFLYTIGYILSGPIPHQIIISHWFRKRRGTAMGITYVGVAVFGSIGAKIVKPLTEAHDFRYTLMVIGGILFLAWPVARLVLRDKPSDKGLFPDNDPDPPKLAAPAPRSMRELLANWPFWLLMIGSFCSIGSIGAVNQHMKLIFQENGFTDQKARDFAWSEATFYILISSIAGRLLVGWLSDKLPKKYVMTATYVLVAATIPLLMIVKPQQTEFIYVFAVLFGLGMGADYMLIPLMAAEQFGLSTLARAMAIILPVNTIGQTWFPYFVSLLQRALGDYQRAMLAVFAISVVGAVAIAMLPKHGGENEALPLPEPGRAAAGR